MYISTPLSPRILARKQVFLISMFFVHICKACVRHNCKVSSLHLHGEKKNVVHLSLTLTKRNAQANSLINRKGFDIIYIIINQSLQPDQEARHVHQAFAAAVLMQNDSQNKLNKLSCFSKNFESLGH